MTMKCKSSDSFYGWVVLGALFIFGLALMPMMMTFSLILPIWVDDLGWSRGLISGAGSLRSVLVGLLSPLVGILIMKIGAKRAIVIGNCINVVALVLMSVMSQLWHLYICYGVIFGMGFAIGGMLGSMTILNNWFSLKRTLALAINGAAMGISGVVINPTLMSLIQNIGWRNTYLIVALVATICCIIIPAIFLVNSPEDLGQVPDGPVKPKVKKEKEGKAPPAIYRTPVDFTAGEALRTKTLWFLVAYNSLQMIAMAGLFTHQIAFLLDIGISPVMAAMAGGIMSAVMSVAQLGVGILGLRFNMHKLAVGSMLLTISGHGHPPVYQKYDNGRYLQHYVRTRFWHSGYCTGNAFPQLFRYKGIPQNNGVYDAI